MTLLDFHKLFKAPGPVVLPVIHALNTEQVRENLRILVGEGAPGCFLINHDYGVDAFLPVIREVRAGWPSLWMGVNFLAVTGRDAFPVLGDLDSEGCRIDAYWADDARIDETGRDTSQARRIAAARAASGWSGLYFGGTAFKKQRPVDPERWKDAAREAVTFMDVVTTSGPATGEEAGARKVRHFRAGAGPAPLALASGVTPENAASYAQVDAFLVATGINREGDFYRIDSVRLGRLMRVAREIGSHG